MCVKTFVANFKKNFGLLAPCNFQLFLFLISFGDCDVTYCSQLVSEEETYVAVVDWVKFDYVKRSKLFKDIFQKLDIHLLTRQFLKEVVLNEVSVSWRWSGV